MAEVVLDSISKTFAGGVEAVRNLSLRINDGELLVLVGPSGCGKTTTLRMIAGLEEPTSGAIRIGERVVNRVHPKDRNIAMVFQDYALYPHMTVRKNLAFGLKMRKVPRAEIDKRVHETASLLGIGDLLDRKPGALSGGQQQRVAVGRAIVRDPLCYLFDEPLSNLDARLRMQMRAELKTLHRRLKTTTIHVTHDQEEAMTLGDRVVVMCGGRLQQVGAPLEVYNAPANRFVAGFLGTPPMNFIEGTMIDDGGRLRFNGPAGFKVSLDSEAAGGLRERAGQNLVLGIRPEALELANTDAVSASAMSVEISVVEPLGDRMDVYAKLPGGQMVIARVAVRQDVSAGQPATLAFKPGSAHLFEAGEFGARL